MDLEDSNSLFGAGVTSFYHDPQSNTLIYPRHALITQMIPEAREINGQFVAVPRSLHNCQVLRHYNFPVAPIITDETYDWPIEAGKKALPHQKVMANFQLLHPKSFNLSDPGTMKTMAALWMADFLMRQYPPGQCQALIVGLLNVLETVWVKAIFSAFLGRRSFEILHGSAEKRCALLAKKPDFAIINVDGVGVGAHTRKKFELDGFSKKLLEDTTRRIVIIDEADAYVDAQTKRHRIARLVLGQREYVTMLTGTPVSQKPTDAYGLAKLMNNALGKSFRGFREETMVQMGPFKWMPRQDGYERARKLLVPAIRFDIRDTWRDAPEMTTQQRLVNLTEEQKKMLAALKRDLLFTVRSGKTVTAANEAVARLKFLQISLGAVYDDTHKAHILDATPRYEEIERIIDSTPRKVLLFIPFTSIVDEMKKQLSKRWKCAVINGQVSPKDRPDIIRSFESDADLKCMLVDAQSVAHGINEFVVADTVIWVGPIDKTRLYIQGNRRAHRPGQLWPVTVYQLVSNALEKEMFRRLETNTSMQGALLDLVRDNAI